MSLEKSFRLRDLHGDKSYIESDDWQYEGFAGASHIPSESLETGDGIGTGYGDGEFGRSCGFNTNVENALAYVYYTMEHAGVVKEEALKRIDRVQQNGMDGSLILKLKDCKTLLEEISGILEALKKYC